LQNSPNKNLASYTLFAEQQKKKNDAKRRANAKSRNNIMHRLIRVDVDSATTTIWSHYNSPWNFTDEKLMLSNIELVDIGLEDARRGKGICMVNGRQISNYMGKLLTAMLEGGITPVIYIVRKNKKYPEFHSLLITRSLDWLFFKQHFQTEIINKNDRIPAVLAKLDHTFYSPAINRKSDIMPMQTIEDAWVQYLETLDLYNETAKYTLFQPVEMFRYKTQNGAILKSRVYVLRSMVGMTSEIKQTVREAGFTWSHQMRQWQSLRPNLDVLSELFTTIDFTPLSALGFLPEYRARALRNERITKLNPELWDFTLGFTDKTS